MTTNLEKAQAALDAVDCASARLRPHLAAPAPSGPETADDLVLPVILEVARSLRRASEELCLFIATEALDRGHSPTLLDWQDE